MIGQLQLQEHLAKYSLNTLPRNLFFIGEKGCGKHTLVQELANKFKLPTVMIDPSIDGDTLIDYQQFPIKRMYLIDLTKFTASQQNKLLKFIEEPSDTVYISLIAESEINILNTITNRCIKYYFSPYTLSQLQSLNWLSTEVDELVYKVCKTPGQVLAADSTSIHQLENLCNTIIQKINLATFENTLSIAAQINYKEEYDKYDFYLFFNMLIYCAFEDYKKTNSNQSLKIYLFTIKFKEQELNKIIVKENFILNFLTQLWEITRK